MNRIQQATIAAALLLAGTAVRADEQAIQLHATTTVGHETVILDLFADTGDVPLRSFGVQVKFKADTLSLVSAGRYEELWFLARESGERLPYTDAEVLEPGCVRLVGGRLEAANPERGVTGSRVLLATLQFKAAAGIEPEFQFDFASPAPFANFVQADGTCVDAAVEPAGTEVAIAEASLDRDNDGLPDHFERAAFGDLTTSEGQGDTDGDGESDLDEWIRGTDPTDPNSRSSLRIEVLADGSKLVTWTGSPGRVYELQHSGNLGRFGVLATGIAGREGTITVHDESDNSAPRGFYRVHTSLSTAGR